MAKPDPALLDPARYPFSCTIETRYRDVDSNMHINNGVMASLLEESRVRFHRASHFAGMHGDSGLTSMVVSAAIEYLGQSRYPEAVSMFVGASRVGNSSYELCQLAMQGNQPVTFARVTMVCVKDDSPATIPDPVRAAAQNWMMKP
jgi:acyl-CoA thioester hydrolase